MRRAARWANFTSDITKQHLGGTVLQLKDTLKPCLKPPLLQQVRNKVNKRKADAIIFWISNYYHQLSGHGLLLVDSAWCISCCRRPKKLETLLMIRKHLQFFFPFCKFYCGTRDTKTRFQCKTSAFNLHVTPYTPLCSMIMKNIAAHLV